MKTIQTFSPHHCVGLQSSLHDQPVQGLPEGGGGGWQVGDVLDVFETSTIRVIGEEDTNKVSGIEIGPTEDLLRKGLIIHVELGLHGQHLLVANVIQKEVSFTTDNKVAPSKSISKLLRNSNVVDQECLPVILGLARVTEDTCNELLFSCQTNCHILVMIN